jgi:prolyl-tRNA editing enzyme YbaK/EbsC (Cys-tRNA(Pro) deacylase)
MEPGERARHPNAARVQAALTALGAAGQVVELADSTRTAAEAAAALGTTLGQIVKSLVFEVDGEPVLVLTSGVNRVALDKVARHLGGTPERAGADLVKRATGYPIGGVPPVGHPAPLKTLVDRDLLAYGELWAAAGTPHAVFPTAPDELVRITGGTVVDLREER